MDVARDTVKYPRIENELVIRVTATDSEKAGWFNLGITAEIEGEQIPFQKLFVALAREESSRLLGSGSWFLIDSPRARSAPVAHRAGPGPH